MARIFIDVHPDGTFETGTYHGCPKAHASNQAEGVTTYMSENGSIEGFGVFRRDYSHIHFELSTCARWRGNWRKWGAFCINKWGVWFEPVARRQRSPVPSPDQAIDARIYSIISRAPGQKMTFGVLKNRMRGEPVKAVWASVARQERAGNLTTVECPRGEVFTISVK